jgi:hypothetical protein
VADQFERLRLGDLDPNATIWRYLTFPKFISLLATHALWFSKLRVLTDTLEGTTPELTRIQLKSQHQKMEDWFQEEHLKQQVRRFVEDNEDDGRELIVANCWVIGTHESKEMWNTYVGNHEGVVIRSTPRGLANSLAVSHDSWWLGRVKYVDFARYDEMTTHEGHQAHLRAFLKSEKYSPENELRVATMNWVAPGCLNPDGSPPNEKQKAGLVYSTDRLGILVRVQLATLIKEIRSAPAASDWHHNLIGLLINKAGVQCHVARSDLPAA